MQKNHDWACVVFLLKGYGFTSLIIIYKHFLLAYRAHICIDTGAIYMGIKKNYIDSSVF